MCCASIASCEAAAAAVSTIPFQRTSQSPDDDTTTAVISGRFDRIIDLEDQFRHVIVPIEIGHRLWRQPPAARDIEWRRRRCGELVDIVQKWREHFRRRYGSLGDALAQARQRRCFTMYQKNAALDRPARGNPTRQLWPVGMAGIFVEPANSRHHLDFLALDAHGLGTVSNEPPERTLCLEAYQQHRGFAVPQPALEMMADTTGIAHAAGRDDDVEAGEHCDCLAFLHRRGAVQMRRAEQSLDVEIGL